MGRKFVYDTIELSQTSPAVFKTLFHIYSLKRTKISKGHSENIYKIFPSNNTFALINSNSVVNLFSLRSLQMILKLALLIQVFSKSDFDIFKESLQSL